MYLNDSERLNNEGNNGYNYAKEHFDRDVLGKKIYKDILKKKYYKV